jgi:hypothetical protein
MIAYRRKLALAAAGAAAALCGLAVAGPSSPEGAHKAGTSSALSARSPWPGLGAQESARAPGPRRQRARPPRSQAPSPATPRSVALAFFSSYLAFSYARPGARIVDATPSLAARIQAQRPQVAPTVAAREPRIAQLTVEAAGSGQWAALAAIEDGALRYTLLARLAKVQGWPRVVGFTPWG